MNQKTAHGVHIATVQSFSEQKHVVFVDICSAKTVVILLQLLRPKKNHQVTRSFVGTIFNTNQQANRVGWLANLNELE